MPKSSNEQTAFLGGGWSRYSQGRSDDPRYRQAMSVALNTIVLEEGAAARRSGTMRIAPTRNRQAAKLLGFLAGTTCAFAIEATPNNIQFYSGGSPIFSNDARTVSTSSYNAGTGTITLGLDAAHGWSVGDCIMLKFAAGYTVANEALCRGRVMQLVSGSTGSTLALQTDDAKALPLTVFTTNVSLVGATVYRIIRFSTTYAAADLSGLRLVQAQQNGIILSANSKPEVLIVTEPSGGQDPTFTYTALTLVDGPYLDPQSQSLSLSGTSGSITLTAGSSVFASTDVGRAVRILTQPASWQGGTTYSVGNTVTDASGAWWTSLINSNTGNTPGQPATVNGVQQLAWAPAPTAGTWAWGLITAFTNATTVSFTFDTTVPNMALIAANGTTAFLWQLGVYSATTGYPTCGVYFEGRLYLAGAVPNRFDATVPNGIVGGVATFSYTDPFDNVLDNSGLAEVLNAASLNNINWMQTSAEGVRVGTYEGEWLLSASTLGDPITPVSIQAHLVTKFGSETVEPVNVGIATIFPQRYGKRIIEFLSDSFSQKDTGKPLNERAKHYAASGVAEMAYHNEPVPVIWARMNDGTIAGCTYRRVSRFASEDPVFYGWHQHIYGAPNVGGFTGMCNLPAIDGSGDLLYTVSQDRYGYWVELLQPVQQETDFIRDGWFVDGSPGQTIGRLTKCGFLVPSGGISGTGSVAGSDFGSPVAPVNPALPAAGSTLPTGFSINLAMRNNGVYFNGSSAITSLMTPGKSGASFTLSVWLFTQEDQGALINTAFSSWLNAGVNAVELTQLLGMTQTDSRWSVVNKGIATQSASNGMGGQWANLLVSYNGGTTTGFVYVNDTALDPSQANLNPGNTDFSTLTIGGHAYFSFSNPATPTYDAGSGQLPDADGLISGMAEFWFASGVALDFSVAANRQKFHATDLAAVTWGPVSLGANGQLPTGTKPDIYLSGGPKAFTVNRARGLMVATYNAGQPQVDASLTTLDPLPPSIANLT